MSLKLTLIEDADQFIEEARKLIGEVLAIDPQ